jgi:hypothetical protein
MSGGFCYEIEKAAANDMQSAATMVEMRGVAACCAGYGKVDSSHARSAKIDHTGSISERFAPSRVRLPSRHDDHRKRASTRIPFFCDGGDEGSRTPVRKHADQVFSERSQAFEFPAGKRRLTGLSLW